MHKGYTVGVITTVYNSWSLAYKCISNLVKYDGSLIDEIIIIDDCSPETNAYEFPKNAVIIKNETNLSYVKSVNVAFKHISTDIIILLDADACPVGPVVKNLVDFYHDNESVGVIGLKTLDGKGNDSGNFFYEPKLWELVVGQKISGKLQFLKSKKNIIPYSCAISIRQSCLQDVGTFDENFKFLDGDIDFCMRVHRSNWLLKYTEEVAVYHVGGGSIKSNANRVLMFYESRWNLFKKYRMIPSVFLIKNMVLIRLYLEYYTLVVFGSFIFKDDDSRIDKLKGRKQLISYCKTSWA